MRRIGPVVVGQLFDPREPGGEFRRKIRRLVAEARRTLLDPRQHADPGEDRVIDQADAAWTAYLKLAPAKPDAKTAYQFVNFYLTQGAVDYAKAARALQAVLVTRPPSAGLYAQLALYNLAAGNTSDYKEARAKAISLADSKQRKDAIAKQLDQYEKEVADAIKAQQKQQQAQSGGTTGSTTPPLKTLPSLGGVSSGGGLNTAGGGPLG